MENKVIIDKDMKIRLLQAVQQGYLMADDFPELFEQAPRNIKTYTREQLLNELETIRKNREDGNN